MDTWMKTSLVVGAIVIVAFLAWAWIEHPEWFASTTATPPVA